jgi:hypothetical protein
VRVAYRFKQAWHHLFPSPYACDLQIVKDVLPEPAVALFHRMSQGDQAHACSVLAVLRRSGPISTDLAQAALLHDVGKVEARLSLAYRTIIVILRSIAPSILHQLGQKDNPPWHRPFYIQLHHAAIGAGLCEAIGCAPRVVQLVMNHDLPRDEAAAMIRDVELAGLRAADNTC